MRYKEFKFPEESEPYTQEILFDSSMSYFVSYFFSVGVGFNISLICFRDHVSPCVSER